MGEDERTAGFSAVDRRSCQRAAADPLGRQEELETEPFLDRLDRLGLTPVYRADIRSGALYRLQGVRRHPALRLECIASDLVDIAKGECRRAARRDRHG